MNNKDFITFCKCGCGNGVVLQLEKEGDELYLQLVSDNFYLMQSKGNMSIKEKLKRIWCILANKEYGFFDIFMDRDDIEKFKEFVTNL